MKLPSDGTTITLTSEPLVLDVNDPPAPSADSLNKLLPPSRQDGTGVMFLAVLEMVRAGLNIVWSRAGIALNAQRSPAFADGLELRAWGARLKRPQIVGETEPQYRARLLTPFKVITPAAIKEPVTALVAEVTNIAPVFLEPAVDACFCAPTTFAAGAPNWSSFQQPATRRLWALDESRPGVKYGAYVVPATLPPQFWVIVPEAGDDSQAPHTMPTTSAQIADPVDFLNSAALAWKALPISGAVSRDFTASVRLRNGQVLITGGVITAGGAPTATTFLFDPASGALVAAASMNTARARHKILLLDDGQAMVVGGHSDAAKATALASCEVYDPIGNAWSTIAPMSTARYALQLLQLRDRRFLAICGTNGAGAALSSCELFTAATNTWTAAGSLATARDSGFSATILPTGCVLVTGTAALSANCERYTPAAGSAGAWASAANITTPRIAHQAVLTRDGRVLVIGGKSSLPNGSSSVIESYREADDTWTTMPGLIGARDGHAAVLGAAGIYVLGGKNVTTQIATCELYDPMTNTVSTLTALSAARLNHEVILLPGDEPLVICGDDNTNPLSSIERFAPVLTAYNFVPTRPSSLLERIVGEVEPRRASGYTWFLVADPLLGTDA